MISYINQCLNNYYLFQWVGDYKRCLDYKEELVKIQSINKNKLDSILKDELNKVINSFKRLKNNLKFIEENPEVFKKGSNELMSYLMYRYNPVTYKVNGVIKDPKEWKPQFKQKIEGCSLEKVVDVNLEVIYFIERPEWFGTVSFSSLGIFTGEIYKCNRKKSIDWRASVMEVIEAICKYIY